MQQLPFLRHSSSLLLLALLAAGCGGADYSIAPVSGKVTKNGSEPYPGVVVSFQPIGGENLNPGPTSAGITGPDGTYRLILHDEVTQEGAVVGEHKIMLWTDMKSTDDASNWNDPIPRRYNQESKVKFSVPPEGSTEANFDVTFP